MKVKNDKNSGKFVDAEGLLGALFDEKSRPSVRWVREMQKRKAFPYLKLNHLVRFDVGAVKKYLSAKHTVEAKV